MNKNTIEVCIVKNGKFTGRRVFFETDEDINICNHCGSANVESKLLGHNDTYQIRCLDCEKLIRILPPKRITNV